MPASAIGIARATALAWLALMLLLACPYGHAQVYPCAGPGPGEIVVGQTPGGQGVAPMPLCQRSGRSQQGVPQAPRIRTDYGAFAIDEHGTLYHETSLLTQGQAESMALQSCMNKPGAHCQLLGWFKNTCMTYARDASGQVYPGTLAGETDDPADNAMRECNRKTPVGKCTLLGMPLCSGTGREGGNAVAAAASPELLEYLSAKMDTRDYWGSIAYNGANMAAAHDEPTQQLAETSALAGCAGCRIVVTFKNSCAAIARPVDKPSVFDIAEDADPTNAVTKAASQCREKHDTCEAQVRCSGRKYPEANPYEANGMPPP